MIRALAGDGRGSGYFNCTKWKAPTEEAGRALQLGNADSLFGQCEQGAAHPCTLSWGCSQLPWCRFWSDRELLLGWPLPAKQAMKGLFGESHHAGVGGELVSSSGTLLRHLWGSGEHENRAGA